MHNTKTLEKIKKLIKNKNNQIYTDIANYLSNNIKNLSTITIKEISRATFTSEATITRFSQEIGLSGFKELKFTLNHEINQDNFDYDFKQNYDELLEIVEKNIDFFRQMKSNIISISEMIIKAKRIFIYGFGGNANIIKIFNNYLIRMNKNAVYISDRDDQLAYSQNQTKEDLNLLISFKFRDSRWPQIFKNINGEQGQKIILTTKKNNLNFEKINILEDDTVIEIPFNEGHQFSRDNCEVSFLLLLMLIIEHLLAKNNLDKILQAQDNY